MAGMRPPKGFEAEKYPLRHKLKFGFALGIGSESLNTAFCPIVMHSKDIDIQAPAIRVNPHSDAYQEENGPLCQNMSIIDKMRISLKFQMTNSCDVPAHTSGLSGSEVFTGDGIGSFTFLWRPIFNVYPEKMDAKDDDTETTVATILAMTKDATNEDIVPITTTKLVTAGPSELALPVSNINAVQIFSDFNMTTNTAMEDHVFDENLLQDALLRYTNKGALRSCLGRTRHVTLTRNRPFKNFFIDKFVPRAVRRIQSYGMFGIQIHVPFESDIEQHFLNTAPSNEGHLGVKILAKYNEWNIEHSQDPQDA